MRCLEIKRLCPGLVTLRSRAWNQTLSLVYTPRAVSGNTTAAPKQKPPNKKVESLPPFLSLFLPFYLPP